MRKGLIGLVGAMAALALTMATNGCSDPVTGSGASGGSGSGGSASGGAGSGGTASGGAGSGGSQASGGSTGSGGSRATGGMTGSGGSRAIGGSTGSGGQTTNCTNGSTCGGNLVGTWDVTSSCLTLSGDMDVVFASLGCPTVPVTGSLQVTGKWTANADGTYTDNTTTTGSIAFPLAPGCLSVSSVDVECSRMGNAFTPLGWKTATCSTNASGQCNCTATADQSGGLGVISPWKSNSGTYTTSSGGGLNADDYVDYSYCVSGNTLTVTPKPTILPVTGTIVLQKEGTSATGGTTGRGGATGSGGRTGSGGATTSSGGRTGSGGATTTSGGRTGSGGATTGSGGTTATGGTTAGGSTGSRPCDIYAAASNTCVAAHSTVRALFASYSGALYQVRRASDKTTKDIGVLSAGGLADAAAQDSFCSGTTCVIVQVYDQTKNANHIGCQAAADCPNQGKDSPASATAETLNVSGQKVYALKMKPAQAYWKDGSNSGMPKGSSPQGIYMVTSGVYYNNGCCFDYGNGPTTRQMSGGGTMDALYFGNSTQWGSGNGTGPWVMADLEGGIYSQGGTGGKNNNLLSLPHTYVTAVEKNNGTNEFALRGGNATTGNLSTFYKGGLPNNYRMQRQGAIILGSGGDCCYSNSNLSQGTLYEGAIVSGYPSDATEDAVQANVISAGYGK